VAAATAAAARATASGRRGERFGRAACDGGAKDGELDACLLAGTFWASNFLLFVEDKLFELSFAIVANVFVDGHEIIIAPEKWRRGGSREHLDDFKAQLV